MIIPPIKVMSVEKCRSCLLVTWPKPHRLDKTGRPFSLFYEVNCAEVKGRGKLVAITESLELLVTGLNYSTEYRCFVTPINSHGRGSASNIVVKETGLFNACIRIVQVHYPCLIPNVTGKRDEIRTCEVGGVTILDQILTPVIMFPIIGVLALLSLCLCFCLCIVCCCCRSPKWSSYNV